MGSIRSSFTVKHFVGVLVSSRDLIAPTRDRLAALYGTIDHESPVIPFDSTDYYASEMGGTIDRVFFSFEGLIEADQLPDIKRKTNVLEEELRPLLGSVKRPVNLDPGYLENAKVVLASAKNFPHRVYLGSGIFAEVTMYFKHNTFHFFPWTFADYRSREYQDFFLRVRHIYRSQLKTMCIVNRKESH